METGLGFNMNILHLSEPCPCVCWPSLLYFAFGADILHVLSTSIVIIYQQIPKLWLQRQKYP